MIQEILKRCGKYLEKIIISEYYRCDCMCSIADYCKNIQSIIFHDFSLEGIKNISRNCSNISELCFHSTRADTEQTEKALAQLFSNNRKLKVLKIKSFYIGSFECLLKLPLNELEEIKINPYNPYEDREYMGLKLAVKSSG